MSVYENAAGECEGDGSDYSYLQCGEGTYAGEYGAFDVLDVGCMDGWMKNGRLRERISIWAGTPSGDTTRTP